MISYNAQLSCVTFKISGRSTGGTAKIEHLVRAINIYRHHNQGAKYIPVTIQLEDGISCRETAKQIITGYVRAAHTLENTVRKFGGWVDIDVGFVRL